MFKNISGINKLILVFNFFAVVLLFGSYLSLFISPSKVYILAFLGLGYPILLLSNTIFCVYWSILFKPHFIISIVAILIGFVLIPRNIQIKLSNPEITNKTAGDSLIKVMSYNVKLFDLYNWTNNNKTRDKIFQFVNKQQADVFNCQEFYADDKSLFLNIDSFKSKTGFQFTNIHYTTTLRKTDHWGIATFSKYPIINRGVIKFETKANNSCIFSDIVKGKDTIRFYNLHLQSIHFKNEDYLFLDSLNKSMDVEEVKGARKILGKLKRAFVKRSKQVDLVIDHIFKSPYKVVVTGDFNDTPVSYTYQQFSKNLNDAFIESGVGIGSSSTSILPQRIDYIFTSPNLKTYSFKTIPINLSDHYPIITYIK